MRLEAAVPPGVAPGAAGSSKVIGISSKPVGAGFRAESTVEVGLDRIRSAGI
jgi:hypothetical protein